MAAGTFVTAKLMRTDNQTPWGFRLQGGQEFNIPLAMGKVSEGSLAEQAGVQVGDIILKINGKECDTMRHKEAQDAIVNAGNYLELYLERGPMNTWKPNVTPVGSFDIRNKSHSMEPQTFTKTSLAKQNEEYSAIGSGHNSSAKPFSPPKLVHKQFNSPINLYSEKSLEETLNAHTQVLSSGATGINFMRPDAPVNKDSAVFQMVQEEERRKAKGLSGSPDKNGFHDGAPSDGPIKHVQAPSGVPNPPKPDDRNRNICASCERLIVGVFVRVNNKSLHADCFVCATCGTSLKNIGYFNINDKLYCDIHARQIRAVLGDSGAQPYGQPNSGPASFSASQPPGSYLGARSNASAAASSFDGGYLSSGGNVNVSPQQSNNYAPPSINSYQQSTNFSSTHNGFQSYSQEPKKFSPVVPPTAPKPNFNANSNRNSMFVNLPSSYNFSQETQSSVNQRFNMPNEPPIQPQTNSMNNSAANYLSSTLSRQMASAGQNRPKSCYSSLPSAYTVTTNTYESRTTTNYGPNEPNANANTNNLPYYPKTATYASSTQTTYSMPPPGNDSIAPKIAPGPNYGPMPAAPVPPAGISNATRTNSSSTTTFGAKTNISDSRSAPKRGKGFLQSQLTGGVIPFCGYCSQPIRGQYIMALNKTWCPNHFVCANTLCKRSLEQSGFVEEQGRLYCDTCYETHFAPNCTKCHQRIKGDCLNALDRQWHPECFTCYHCRKPFGNSSFYLEDSYPYCEKDWNDLFTTKCVGCGYPIAAGDRWVEALNQNYHSNCFQCTVCHNNLEGQSFFAKGGRPYCKAHAR